MKHWIESYKELAARTRWISVTGALILGLIAGAESVGTISSLANTEVGLVESIRWIGFSKLFPLIVVALIAVRILALTIKNAEFHWVGSLSWLLLAVTMSVLVTLEMSATPIPNECVPEPDKICFSIYTNVQEPLTPFASVVYLMLGIVRFSITSFVAIIKCKTKLK